MKSVSIRIVAFAAILGSLLVAGAVRVGATVDEGEALFKKICVACHTIGGGKLVGPDLANVTQRRPMEWILKYVKSSQTVIKSGDPYATQLFAQFNNVIMPDNPFTDAQITSIMEYITANSPGAGSGGAPAAASEPAPITEKNISSGKALFMGEKGFENGGPTCISCHNVDRAGVTAGGALAKDLTNAHTRLGQAGVKAIIANSPFAAMNQAFAGKRLTDAEVFDLAAFLQQTDGASGRGPHYGARLFFSGVGGAILLIGLFSGVWFRAKRRSVNHAIYERQVTSTWEVTDDSERTG